MDTSEISRLKSAIANLQSQNKDLNDEYDEYESFKNALNSLIEDHVSCWERDNNALDAPGVNPSCCINSFLDKLRNQLESSSAKSLSGKASSLAERAIKKQLAISDKITANNTAISNYWKKINSNSPGSTTVKA